MSRGKPATRWQRGIGIGALSLLVLVGVAKAAGLRLNLSASVPCGLWREVPFVAERDHFALLCPPNVQWLRDLVDAGHLPPGHCDSGAAPFIKRIAGVGGDHVRIDRTGVAINHNKERLSAPLRAELVQPFTGRLDADRLVYVNTMASSIDSRYFGAIGNDRVHAGMEPLWVWPTLCQ